jgi:hypothetical protein
MKKPYCCDRFKEYLVKKGITQKEIDGIPSWITSDGFRIYHCPFCSKFISSKTVPEKPHIDLQNNCTSSLHLSVFGGKTDNNIETTKDHKKKYCCDRFRDFAKEDEIIYAYKYSRAIDETAWIVDGHFHIYYCPFCGTYIKGRGFGVTPKPYRK